MALALASCNEKVSPELQGANATSVTTPGGPTIVPTEYYFRIANSSDTMLNYKLHKSGSGNANADCKISGNLPLSSDLYRANPDAYDISCFFEAEELSLHFNGMDFSLESSPNTCEYIGYAPFSYYTQMPGDSSGSYTSTVCDAATSTAFLALRGVANVTCDTYAAIPGTTPAFSVPSGKEAETLCRFNGKDELPDCDIGEIVVTETSYVRGPGADNILGNGDDTLDDTTETREIDCGGKIYNCIEGGIKFEGLLSRSTSGMVIKKSTIDQAQSIKKSLTALMGDYGSNRRYVNFRRDLASFEIEYGNSDKPLTNGYSSAFGDPSNSKEFNPELMQNYSYNKKMDGNTLVTSVPTRDPSNRFWYRPYAADPFLGLFGARTNPHYVAYCLDNAFDIKARIKMLVRDWDRVLPGSATNTYFERISDVDQLPPIARQDVPYTDEITGDTDSWNAFNDVSDWDDLVEMERDDSNLPYDPAITIWRPLPDATYTTGFFNPAWFPYDKLDE